VTSVENDGEMAQFRDRIVIKELLRKLSQYLRLQWGQYLVQIRTNDVKIQENINQYETNLKKVVSNQDGKWLRITNLKPPAKKILNF
jgi:hypothetical protein